MNKFKGFRTKQCVPQMLHEYLLNMIFLDTTLPLSVDIISLYVRALLANMICPTD